MSFRDKPVYDEIGKVNPVSQRLREAYVRLVLCSLGGVFLFSSAKVHSQPGSLDPTFAPEITNLVTHVRALPDGKLLVATRSGGGLGGDLRLIRLSSDGTVEDSPRGLPGAGINALIVQADGRVLASVSDNSPGPDRLLRLNADGTFDSTFQAPPLYNDATTPAAVLVQPDGSILVNRWVTGIARLTPHGGIDAAFAPALPTNAAVTAIALQADGKILVSLHSRLLRLNNNGSLDPSFPTEAMSAGAQVEQIHVQADASILLVGNFPVGGGRFARQLLRLDPSGSVKSESPFSLPGPAMMVRESAGKILIASLRQTLLLNDPVLGTLLRLNSDLSVDQTFAPAEFRKGMFDSSAFSLALQADGQIVAGGNFDAVNGVPRTGLARIRNDESSAAGFVEFTTNAITINEADRILTVGVRRRGGTNGFVTVNYGAAAQTASAGTDFVSVTGLITFEDGESGEKFVSFETLQDQAGEGNETFQLTLANPLGGLSLGATAACHVTILDDDTAVEFASPRVDIFEPSGLPPITISRKGFLGLHTSVTVEAVEGTAESPADFTMPVATVHFLPGESNKVVNLSVQDDFLPELAESAYLRITGVTGGGLAPDKTSTEISILDNDRPGSVDHSFQQPSFGWWAWGSALTAVVLQPDGRIIVGGHFTFINDKQARGMARLYPDGTLDPSFLPNSNGLFIVRNSSFLMPVTALALQPDGKILFVHSTVAQFIGRMDSSGTPDPSFSTVSVGGVVKDLQVLPSGKIMIGGSFGSVGDVRCLGIARLLPDGKLDPTFKSRLDLDSRVPFVNAIARQSDGKWIIGGKFTSIGGIRRTNIARLHVNGASDESFNAHGLVARDAYGLVGPDSGSYVAALAIRPNGKILVGGHFNPAPQSTSRNLLCLQLDGALDGRFNAGGRGTDLTLQSHVSEITLQRDGRILIAGYFSKFNQTPRNSLARLLRNGALDVDFDADIWTTPVQLNDMLIQPDDQIVVAGDFDYFDLAVNGIARLNSGVTGFRFFDVRRLPGVGTSLRFQAPAGTTYDLQRSADLADWRSILSISNQTHWTDSNSATLPKRFYRAVRTSP